MDADPELDTALGRQAGVALGHAGLHLDRTTHRVDHAAELDHAAVAGSLDDAPLMQSNGRIDEVAEQRPEPRQGAILIRPGEPAVADDVRDQDCSELAGFPQGAPSGRHSE